MKRIKPAIPETHYHRHLLPFQKKVREFPSHVNVCIIGAGYAGLGTASSLLERNFKGSVAVLEKEEIGHGASGRNGGFVFGGFSLPPEQLLKQLGPENAKEIYSLTASAVHLIKNRIRKYNIECQVVEEPGILLVNWFDDSNILHHHRELMLRYFDTDWELLSTSQTKELLNTNRYYGSLLEKNAFHFNPLLYLTGLYKFLCQSDNMYIYENTPALSITQKSSSFIVQTPKGPISTDHVVVCCGGYFKSFYPELGRSVLPISTYCMTTKEIPEKILSGAINTTAAVYDTRFAFDYYRALHPEQRVLWGGRIEIDRSRSLQNISYLLKKDMVKVFPQLKNVEVDLAWSGLMAYCIHQMPVIGYSKPRLWHAFGFGGHGVAPTALSGEILADCIVSDNGKSIPNGFNHYGPLNSFSGLGLMGVQLTYWYYQLRDVLKDRFKF